MMATTQRLITAEEFYAMPDISGKWVELVRGVVVGAEEADVPTAGAKHGWIAAMIFRLLDAYSFPRDLGFLFGDGVGYVVSRDPDTIRVPDVSFLRHERVPNGEVPDGFWPFAPDLAVEVVSPGDSANELRDKVDQYLTAGTRLVWVVWPKQQRVSVHAPNSATRELRADDELDGGDVLPGFRVRIADLFTTRR